MSPSMAKNSCINESPYPLSPLHFSYLIRGTKTVGSSILFIITSCLCVFVKLKMARMFKLLTVFACYVILRRAIGKETKLYEFNTGCLATAEAPYCYLVCKIIDIGTKINVRSFEIVSKPKSRSLLTYAHRN